jgi:hypothetical protein
MADYCSCSGRLDADQKEQDAMAAWDAWFGELGGIRTGATPSRRRPRASPRTAWSATARGRRHGERLPLIVKADSPDEAVEKAKGSRAEGRREHHGVRDLEVM